MESLGLGFWGITLSVLVWAVIENVHFVKRVLVNPNGYDEKARKTTKILLFVSLALAAVLISICFCLYNTAYSFVISVNFIFFFFINLPFWVVFWMIIEFIKMLAASKQKPKQDGENEPDRKPKNIFLILLVYLVVTICLCIVLRMILDTLPHK